MDDANKEKFLDEFIENFKQLKSERILDFI